MSRYDARRRTGLVVTALVTIHVVFSLARVPHSAIGQRLEDIAEHEHRGPVRFHLDNRYRKGAEEVEWILEHVPENGVVLQGGELQGSLEFVPTLIWPRLLVQIGEVDSNAESFDGRPIARRDGRQLVLVGLGDDLALETR
ncbi:MAG: hypothetical protein KDB80_06760 [Planctomycetes bacterium]|nr:hypothetical protein [Planctomycetota bacterium]